MNIFSMTVIEKRLTMTVMALLVAIFLHYDGHGEVFL